MAELPQGFIARPARMDDLEEAVALFNAYSIEHVGRPRFVPEEIRVEWESPTMHLGENTHVVLAPDGRLVGYVEVWLHPPYVAVHVFARVHPQYRGLGIGGFLSDWAEARAREAAIPQAPEGSRVSLLQGVLSTDSPTRRLLEEKGYELVRHSFRMEIELQEKPPEPDLPEGIEIRPLERGQERAVVRAVREAFRDHWGYMERPFEEEFEEWQYWIENEPEFDPTLWFLAMDGDEIAGVSLCRSRMPEDPDMGFVNSLGVRRPWRRQGLGLALLLHSFREFYERGRCRVGLGVDAQSLTGATRLYERAGMHVARRYVTYEKVLRPGEDLRTQELEPER